LSTVRANQPASAPPRTTAPPTTAASQAQKTSLRTAAAAPAGSDPASVLARSPNPEGTVPTVIGSDDIGRV
jgi:hypothetical protein